MTKHKLQRKLLALILSIIITFNPLLVRVSFAEEIPTITPTPTDQATPTPTPDTTPQSTPTTDPTPTPTVGPSEPTATPTPTTVAETTTGNANAAAETQTTANTHEATTSGSLTTGNCTLNATASGCTNVNNSNSAEATNSANSNASTGDNQSSNQNGDVSITSGSATASGQIQNELNTNSLTLEASGSATPSATPEATDSASSENSITPTVTPSTLDISNTNSATASNNANVSAQTGQNQASAGGNADINTGDATALANLLNLINTNLLGSAYKIIFIDIKDQTGDINLYEEWLKLNNQQETQGNLTLTVLNDNFANLTNQVNVLALSGQNQAAAGGTASTTTGNATALANVINFSNTNIVGSRFIIGIINIWGNFTGNIILPSKEDIAQNLTINNNGGAQSTQGAETASSNSSGGGLQLENQNQVSTNDQVGTLANSGRNESTGSGNTTSTGNATAKSNIFSLLNTNITASDWLFLLINNLGLFNGKILSWQDAGSNNTLTDQSTTYSSQTGTGGTSAQGASLGNPQAGEGDINSGGSTIRNQNAANVENNINAVADTGGNKLNGTSTDLKTGDAKALANLLNIVNTNILGSNWLFNLVNIMGRMNGNIVFAYPDVALNISHDRDPIREGEGVAYGVTYENKGYKEAKDVKVELLLPQGVTQAFGPDGFNWQRNGQALVVDLGNLEPHAKGGFKINVVTDPNFNSIQEKLQSSSKGDLLSNLKEFLIRPAFAQEKSLIIKAVITNGNKDADTSNNATADQVTVEDKVNESEGGKDNNQNQNVPPVLEVQSKNNVGEYVYPGDTVTYEIKVKNTGNGVSNNTTLFMEMLGPDNLSQGGTSFNLGTLHSQKSMKVNFGLFLIKDLNPGVYTTIAYAVGHDDQGKEYVSKESINFFLIKEKYTAQSPVGEVKAAESQPPSVPGEVLASEKTPVCRKEKDRLPYILALLITILWFIDRQNSGANDKFLKRLAYNFKTRFRKNKAI